MVKLAKENIALAGEKAALSTILALLSKLQQRATKATQAREAIRDQHTKICTFEKKVVSQNLFIYLFFGGGYSMQQTKKNSILNIYFLIFLRLS